MTGLTYLERGEPVVVLIRWETRPPAVGSVIWHRPPRRNGPRNVLIERGDGNLVVRPFRGLRTPPAGPLPLLGAGAIDDVCADTPSRRSASNRDC